MAKKSGDQSRKNENGTQGPILGSGIGHRISEVASAVGTRKKAAFVAGISADTLQRYIREDVAPSFEPLANLAKAAGVSLDWLASGEGDKHGGVKEESATYLASAPSEPLDIELIKQIIILLEKSLKRARKSLDPESKARAIEFLYFNELERRAADDDDGSADERIIDFAKYVGRSK